MLEEKIDKCFKLPIFFSENCNPVPDNIINELELITTKNNNDPSSNLAKPQQKTIYNDLLNIKTEFDNVILKQLISNYTTDINFLKDTQKIISDLSSSNIKSDESVFNAWESFKNIKEDVGFLDRYQYVNWEQLKFLNTSVLFLTIYSFYSIISPALNVAAPLFILLVPFFVLKMKKIPITISGYVKILITSIKNNTLGRLVTQWNTIPTGQKIYMMVMMGMYVYNIYQNLLSCYRFYKNTSTINKNIHNIKHFLNNTAHKIKNFISLSNKYSAYKKYNKYLQENLKEIEILHTSLEKIPIAGMGPKNISCLGYTLKQYFIIYDSYDIENIMLFCFGFNGYLDKITGLCESIKDKKIRKATFKKSDTAILKFKKLYNPTIKSEKIVKNTFNINKNKLITGPNASGKTTLLKTTIINTILSQQMGFGYYKSAVITPFDHFHCYINIPDTSSRDSLFQAEARRCLDIINTINKSQNQKHFCIFDELFSGTNPYEAISSAQSYLEYLSEFKGTRLLLTTHFIELCMKFKKHKKFSNINMETIIINNNAQYKYKIKKGISTAKGGISVLKQLEYPDKIVKNTINNLKDM